jgi:hypothetical protein
MDNDCERPTVADLITRMNDHTTDKDRPFTGQPHTHQGQRGKTMVGGIRFRDLADCVARAFVHSAGFTLDDPDVIYGRAEDGTLNYNDLHDLDLSRMDPVALIQNTVCEVEKAMGIYPNIEANNGQK